jgi:hypothetical protein
LSSSTTRVSAFADIHMQTVMPIGAQPSPIYEQPQGGRRHASGLRTTVESGKALWRLSRRALARPEVAKLIAETPREELPAALQGTAEGRAFWQELEQYLERFGWRSDAFELSDPAWAEDPSILLSALRDYLTARDDADPALKEQRCREEREEVLQDVMSRLDGHTGKPIRNDAGHRAAAPADPGEPQLPSIR